MDQRNQGLKLRIWIDELNDGDWGFERGDSKDWT